MSDSGRERRFKCDACKDWHDKNDYRTCAENLEVQRDRAIGERDAARGIIAKHDAGEAIPNVEPPAALIAALQGTNNVLVKVLIEATYRTDPTWYEEGSRSAMDIAQVDVCGYPGDFLTMVESFNLLSAEFVPDKKEKS